MANYVAKCDLGKVKLEALLASNFPSYTRSGPMLLAGAPHGWHTQFLTRSSCQVIAIAIVFRIIVRAFPIPPFPPLKAWAR